MRKYIRKTNRAIIPEENIRAALIDICEGRTNIRQAAEKHGIKKSTLCSRLKNLKNDPEAPLGIITLGMGLKTKSKLSKNSSRQVFSVPEENLLEEYFLTSSKLNYGITLDAMQELAYLFAVSVASIMPKNWYDNQKTGRDWAMAFTKRHSKLSIQKSETNLARALYPTKTNVDIFYDNLEELTNLHDFKSNAIWNIHETNLSSLLPSADALMNDGAEQITIIGMVSAAGVALSPVYVFPTHRKHEEFMEGSPQGSTALFNGTGLMNGDTFVEVLKHVLIYTAPSKEHPILLVLDCHTSRVTFSALEFCHDNGIHLISFPPHTNHRAKSSDITVFGPFEVTCKVLFERWLTENHGESLTVFKIVRLSSEAMQDTFTVENIRPGFANAGIYPINRVSLFRELYTRCDAVSDPLQPSCSSQLPTPAFEFLALNCPPTLESEYLSSGETEGTAGGNEHVAIKLEDMWLET